MEGFLQHGRKTVDSRPEAQNGGCVFRQKVRAFVKPKQGFFERFLEALRGRSTCRRRRLRDNGGIGKSLGFDEITHAARELYVRGIAMRDHVVGTGRGILESHGSKAGDGHDNNTGYQQGQHQLLAKLQIIECHGQSTVPSDASCPIQVSELLTVPQSRRNLSSPRAGRQR